MIATPGTPELFAQYVLPARQVEEPSQAFQRCRYDPLLLRHRPASPHFLTHTVQHHRAEDDAEEGAVPAGTRPNICFVIFLGNYKNYWCIGIPNNAGRIWRDYSLGLWIPVLRHRHKIQTEQTHFDLLLPTRGFVYAHQILDRH
jgi:hypothetical protein